MKLAKQEQDIVRRKFCAYCIKVLDGEAKNYLYELDKIREQEVNFSELHDDEWSQLNWNDELPDMDFFQVMDMSIPVKDDSISSALKKLPERKRLVILMAYFLDMTEKEIADYLKLVQSTVHYHKTDSLRLLKKLLE